MKDLNLFYGILIFVSIVVFLTLVCLGKIFDRLRELSEDEWRNLGSPVIRLSLYPNKMKARLPNKFAVIQYVWVLSPPCWSRGDYRLRQLFKMYRVLSFLGLVGAVAVLYYVGGRE